MKIIKYICSKPGYKKDPENPKKCIKMSPEEIKNRKKAAKKAVLKRKSKLLDIIRKARKTKLKNQQKHIQIIKKEIHQSKGIELPFIFLLLFIQIAFVLLIKSVKELENDENFKK